MDAFVTSTLATFGQLAPLFQDATSIGSVISFLENTAIPFVKAEAHDVAAPISNIIEALQNNGATTPEQQAKLTQLDAATDAAYDAAKAAFDIAHPAGA